MADDRLDPPPVLVYMAALALQFPVWMAGGMVWATFMTVLAGSKPGGAFVGGLFWGLSSWVLMGNLVAAGIAWRRTAELPTSDRAALGAAVRTAADKLKLAVWDEAPGRLVFGPRRSPFQFRAQEVRVTMADGITSLSAPAISFGPVRKAIQKALDEADGR